MQPHLPQMSGGGLVTVIAFVAALGAAVMLVDVPGPSPTPPLPSKPRASAPRPAFDTSRFILNALLVPALDSDAVPLRWADPRPPSHCGPDTEVRVNREPLAPGALVPDAPFDIEWQADGCHPLGASGPRFDGPVRLTVFREDWGLSAIVETSGLHVSFAGHDATWSGRLGASLPVLDDAFEPVEQTDIAGAD